MSWTVLLEPRFEAELDELHATVRIELIARAERPAEHGPALGRPTVDQPPSTPDNFVIDIYSSTAAAISWDRSTDDRGAVVGYEIVRDRTLIGVRDTLGYVDFSLSPDTDYVFYITTIDNAGQRSGTTNVYLRTLENRGNGDPAAPAGLRAMSTRRRRRRSSGSVRRRSG